MMSQVVLSVAPPVVTVHGFVIKIYCSVSDYVKNCFGTNVTDGQQGTN